MEIGQSVPKYSEKFVSVLSSFCGDPKKMMVGFLWLKKFNGFADLF
jgi:hypothetical protein